MRNTERTAECEQRTVRIILSDPLADAKGQTFAVRVDGGEDLGRLRDDPLFNAARLLVGLGYDPELRLTSRWEGTSYDNFKPAKIGWLAKKAVIETNRDRLRLVEYRPVTFATKCLPMAAS